MEQDFSDFRPTRVWKRLSPERRLAVAEPFWSDEQSTEQQAEAIAAIALRMKFRTKSVLALPLEKRVKYLSTLPTISDAIVARAMVAYHLEHQRPMMSAFLDSLGITHENGLIADETLPTQDADKLRTAAAELATKFPEDDVSLYFATLVAQDPETWGGLAEHCQSSSRQSLIVSHSLQSQSSVSVVSRSQSAVPVVSPSRWSSACRIHPHWHRSWFAASRSPLCSC